MSQSSEFPLSRSLLVSLLVAYGGVIALHASGLPVWMFLVATLSIVWRVNILRQKWTTPSRSIRVLLVLLLSVLLFLEYPQWAAIEPMLSLLLAALSLKLLEIRYRRDVLLILFLSYFVIACSFLFNQSVLHSAMGIVVAVIVTVVLLQLNSLRLGTAPQYLIKLSVKMLLQSLLLMAVMMLILPRLNPLWSAPLQSGEATVGVSDSMSPGDFDRLIQSDALAMRVTFERGVLEPSQMYWRGLVFDRFDGRRWSRSNAASEERWLLNNRASNTANAFSSHSPSANAVNTFFAGLSAQEQDKVVDYEVLMEPTSNQWLYGVPRARINSSVSSLIYTRQQEVFQLQAVHQRIKYTASSYVGERMASDANAIELSAGERARYTDLPVDSNPLTQAQAREWRQQVSSDQAYINKVLQFYRERFTYTLSPPKLGFHTADEFLFSTLQGFCEHFSSSFSVLMRSVGIPARVVVGYQGGEWDDDKRYVSVYQRDAHAWNEVWLSGRGWVRVDPTAAVAAVRIEQGVSAALPAAERAFVGGRQSIDLQWLSDLRNQWQAMDYRWQQWVLEYDSQQQKNILQQFLGDLHPWKMALMVLVPLMLTALIVGVGLFRSSYLPASQEKKLFLRLQKKLRVSGIEIEQGESITQYCDRAAKQLVEPKVAMLMLIKQSLNRVLYQQNAISMQDAKIIKRYIKKL